MLVNLLRRPWNRLVVRTPTVNYSSQSKKEQRNLVLRKRYEAKQIFGAVIHNDKPGKRKESFKSEQMLLGNRNVEDNVMHFDIPNETPKHSMKAESPEHSSEFYWSTQNSCNLKIIPRQRSKPANKQKPKKDDDEPPQPPSSASHNNGQNDSTKTPENNATDTVNMSALSPANALQSAKNLLKHIIHTTSESIPFDENGLKSIIRYPLVCEKTTPTQAHDAMNSPVRLPSISKVLQATMPEFARIALRKWKLAKIAELGEDGFMQLQKETFARGTNFHSAIEQFLDNGETPDQHSPIINLWHSIDDRLHELNLKPVLMEKPIVHADLKYHGIIDNVSIINNELCAFEWKTSEKVKQRLSATYDAPVQLCAYLGALNADPRYDLTVKNGCVVVAYTNGNAAHVFNLSENELRKYWLAWLQRLQEYWIRVRDGTIPDPV